MAFTKVVGAGIHTLSNIASHNINSSGIITATKFDGPFDGTTGDFSGDVIIGGNLTVNGTTSTIDTNLIGVDKIEVSTALTNVAVAVTHTGSGDLVRLYDGSTQVLTVDDVGNVGLGTDSPTASSSLTLAKSANPTLEFKDFTNNAQALITGSAGGQLVFTTDVNGVNPNSDFIFRADSQTNEIVRFKDTGEVGINESANINGRLHIQHDALNENILYASRYNDQSNDKPLFAVTEAQMDGMGSSGLVIGNHNKDIHLGAAFGASAVVAPGVRKGIRIGTGYGQVGINTSVHAEAWSGLTVRNHVTADNDTIVDIVADDDKVSRLYFSENSNRGKGSIRYSYTSDANFMSFYTNGTASSNERVRITSSGIVNIGGNYTQTTYKTQIQTGTNKFISFGNAAHDDLSNEGSGIFFSRQSDGSKELSSIFGYGNTSLGLAARADISFHAGGSSTYGAAPERLRIASDGLTTLKGDMLINNPSGVSLLQLNDNTNNALHEFGTPGNGDLRITVDKNDAGSSQEFQLYMRGNDAADLAFHIDHDRHVTIPNGNVSVTGSGSFTKTSNNFVLVGSSNAAGAAIVLDGDSNGDGTGADYAYIEHDTSGDLNIVVDNPANAGNIKFFTNTSSERLRITSDGKVAYHYNTGASTIGDIDIRSNNGVHIRGTDGNVNDVNIYIGGSRTNQRKTAIIYDPVGGWCRGDLHFCMNNTGDLSDVDVTDSKMMIKAGGQVLIGTTSSSSFNGVGGHHNLIVAGSTNNTNVLNNSNAAITISNTDGTANNTAGLHFAREDTDGTPHYNGASIVAQFLETMNTGHYPKADLAFLTSSANNNAPSEKMRIAADGRVQIAGQNAIASTSLTHRLLVRSQNDSNAIAIAGRNGDHIGELGFYQSDASTKLAEVEAHSTDLRVISRVGEILLCPSGTTSRATIQASSFKEIIFPQQSDETFAQRVYRTTVSGVTAQAYTKFATVSGTELSSHIKMTTHCTIGSVVCTQDWDIKVGHHHDFFVTSSSLAYTESKIKIVSNGNQNFDLYLQRSGGANQASGATYRVVIHPMSQESVLFNSTVNYSESSSNNVIHEHSSSTGARKITASGGVGGHFIMPGTLTAATKNFSIPHPLPTLTSKKKLVHASIEGPQMDLIYRGKTTLVSGISTVNIDTNSNMTEGTFEELNRNVQCFTTNETGWTNTKGSVTGNKITIIAQDNSCTDTISWMVVGERQDNTAKSLNVTDDDGNLIVEPAIEEDVDTSHLHELYPTL